MRKTIGNILVAYGLVVLVGAVVVGLVTACIAVVYAAYSIGFWVGSITLLLVSAVASMFIGMLIADRI